MNAGFSNLLTLKQQLLSPSLVGSTDYDSRVQLIGLGVAKFFERYCNRKFQYFAGTMDVCSGDRPVWFVNRYPVTVFTKVELRYFRTDPWTDISGQPLATDEGKGMIDFGYTLGRDPIQVRITYNGGYYWPTLDTGDAGYPSTVPADITNNAAGLNPYDFNLPEDLLLAWVTQCRQVWSTADKIGDKISEVGSGNTITDLDINPMVKEILGRYIRRQLT